MMRFSGLNRNFLPQNPPEKQNSPFSRKKKCVIITFILRLVTITEEQLWQRKIP